jgi:L-lactate dehydrogenase complex protein LldF
MIAITTNEGNARLGTAVPRIHVAITGIEKVIPRLEDLATMWPVLSTSGTGQPITCYSTLIGGPRMPNETDGPEEFHVILLDNGRSQLLADAEQRDVLQCIRCGACLNACPVCVLTPHLRGLKEFHHLSSASSLCGACTETCPVKIDLHHHLLHNRRDAVKEGDGGLREGMGWGLWRWAMTSASLFALAGWKVRLSMRLLYGLGLQGTWLDPARAWTRHRAVPVIPIKSFRALWKEWNAGN